MKIALVHDLLTQLGGAERVLEVLHELYPDAPVYTLLYDEERTEARYKKWDIRTSFLQELPKTWSYKWYLPLMPRAAASFDLTGFDLVISDASAFAKAVNVPKNAIHICYCHTPTRYLWQNRQSYLASLRYPAIIKLFARPLLRLLARQDYLVAQKVDVFIANSREVQKRIEKYYNRSSAVLYPPVDTDFFTYDESREKKDYFLWTGRLEPYKRVDLVVDAFSRLNLPIKIVGVGSLTNELIKQKSSNIEFIGRVTDAELKKLYQSARALIFTALEDAGLVMVEAQSCGTPVIAFGGGGALELVNNGINGILFPHQTAESLVEAVKRFQTISFSAADISASTKAYGKLAFKNNFQAKISQAKNNPHENWN